MIEVSLYSVPTDSSVGVSLGKCVDRVRFDKDSMKTTVMEFVKGFMRSNISTLELALNNADIVNFINNDIPMTTKDFACINYWLTKAGYLIQILNVTDDEDNPTGPTGESAEWNVIDYNYLQNDYPTAIKITSENADVTETLKRIVNESGLFDSDKMGSIKNPLQEAVSRLEVVKNQLGRLDPGVSSRVFDILEQVGIKIFLATGE